MVIPNGRFIPGVDRSRSPRVEKESATVYFAVFLTTLIYHIASLLREVLAKG